MIEINIWPGQNCDEWCCLCGNEIGGPGSSRKPFLVACLPDGPVCKGCVGSVHALECVRDEGGDAVAEWLTAEAAACRERAARLEALSVSGVTIAPATWLRFEGAACWDERLVWMDEAERRRKGVA